jgi:hypothetical protein
VREARDWGAPEEVIARIEADAERHEFEVWPENWNALRAFLFVSTQWRTAVIGGGMAPGRLYWIGLDYGAVAAALAGGGLDASPEVWDGLRAMEAAARNALNGVDGEDAGL